MVLPPQGTTALDNKTAAAAGLLCDQLAGELAGGRVGGGVNDLGHPVDGIGDRRAPPEAVVAVAAMDLAALRVDDLGGLEVRVVLGAGRPVKAIDGEERFAGGADDGLRREHGLDHGDAVADDPPGGAAVGDDLDR